MLGLVSRKLSKAQNVRKPSTIKNDLSTINTKIKHNLTEFRIEDTCGTPHS